MKALLCLVAMTVLSMAACEKEGATSQSSPSKESSPSESATPSATPLKPSSGRPAISRGAGIEPPSEWTLEGEWRVTRADEEMFVFKFYGAEATVRYPAKDNEEIAGPIALFSTNGFVITPQDGRRHIFRYAVDDGQVFIGRGESHGIESDKTFSFKVTNKHSIHVDGTNCTLKNAEKVLQSIECKWDREAKTPVFSYDSPIPAMPGPKRSRRLFLVGKTLVSETLYGYKASKVE